MHKKIILSKNESTKIGENVLVVGAAGTGKTYGFVIPNLLQMNASYVVNDLGGYLYKTFGETLKKNGYKIKVLDIADLTHSNHYNPFAYFNEKFGPIDFADHLMWYFSGCDADDKTDLFFRMTEQLYLRACISYCAARFGEGCNLATVYRMLDKIANETQQGNAEFHKLFQALPDDSIAKMFYLAFCENSNQVQINIMKHFQIMFRALALESMNDLTSTDDMELDKICEEKTAIFLVDHGTGIQPHGFLFSFLYIQLFSILAEKLKDRKAYVPVHMIMDEFPNFPFITDLPEIVMQEELKPISISVVIQDISQLKKLYPENWKDFAENCFNKTLFLGSPGLETIEFLSDKYRIGKDTLLSIGENILMIGNKKNIIIDEKFAGKDHKNWNLQ